MSSTSPIHRRSGPYQLRFTPLQRGGRSYQFPCDSSGRVDLDALSEGARNNYFYARAVVGRELASPAILEPDPIAAVD